MRRNISLETIKNQDPNITVGELIKIIESEYEKSEQERSDKINSTIDMYKGKSLLFEDKGSIYNWDFEIIKIDDMTYSSMTTDYDISFGTIGKRISIHNGGFYTRELNPNMSYDQYSTKKLNKGTIIDDFIYQKFYDKIMDIEKDMDIIKNELKSIILINNL